MITGAGIGPGIGAAFVPAMGVGTHGVEPENAGVASAMVGASQQVGGSVGTALLNTIAAGVSHCRKFLFDRSFLIG